MEVPDIGDIDPNFEPQTRARSNTWPLRPKVEVTVDQQSSPASDEANNEGTPQKESLATLAAKKTSSRRNAWGNLSYADLITKAIQSSPEQRLTLSQIYDWMVQNVPYFRDKGDSNSSAGWKNSIRHNLSLHNRFMRVQNEGTGKSSWWVINPDAKPGKPARRRTSSMETNKSLVCKRDRVRKRVRELKNQRDGVASHISGDNYNFSLSPSDPNGQFRERVDSAHSTHSGRLSPIPSVPGFEIDIDKDPEDDPPWDGKNYTSDVYTDTLVDDLIDGMKLVDNPNGLLPDNVMMMATSDNLPSSPQMLSRYNRNNNYSPQYAELPAPPPYPEHRNRSPRQQSPSLLSDLQPNGYEDMAVDIPQPQSQQSMDLYQQQLLPDSSLSMSLNSQGQQTSPNHSMGYLPASPYSQPPQLSPKPKQLSPQPQISPQLSPQMSPQLSPQPSQQTRVSQQQVLLGPHSVLQQQLQAPNNSLLLKALTRNQSPAVQAQQLNLLRSLNQARQQAKLQQYNNAQLSTQINRPSTNSPMDQMPLLINNSANSRLISQLSQPPTSSSQILDQLNQSDASQVGMTAYMGDLVPQQQMNNCRLSGPLPTSTSSTSLGNLNDLELDTLIGCDVDQVIDQELQFDGNLDFNFEPSPQYVDLDTLHVA